mmetsp:Transcript_21857/g.21035  ORF Transcript_21857/g.21035 Transcript_21857/m.21035 type:complete len:106 (-) Transcript_21857:325-642(-)|eukprot:CAMPEP_0170546006 /NCGR_PEP_ID=MMETSP0211-20121228/4392_1 /TAXON_ID=311385 /ORGANISM="Pseudokeronopsis sp., Strain OXSARD2" /LENGTH=105 /DNA_ID=CAMNT_0010850243 /DNA_START=967 /DNA_END=1284 /DNA_ORIENTATION=+
MSQLGGLFNTLFGGGKLVVYLFMEPFLLSKIINALFQYSLTGSEERASEHKICQQLNVDKDTYSPKTQKRVRILKNLMNRDHFDYKPPINCCQNLAARCGNKGGN